ncbi:protocadherin Fat 4 [Sarotherodon galilaeus]
MTLLSMKTFPAFLWGIFIVAASIPETSGSPYTVEPNKTSAQLTTALAFHNKTDSHPAVWGTTHRPAATTVSAAAQSTVVTTVETSTAAISNKTNSSSDSAVPLVPTSTAAAAATSNSAPQLLHTSTALIETQPSHQVTMKETTTHAEDGSHPQSTTAPTDTTAPTTFSSTAAVSSPQPTSITESEMTSVSSSTFSSEKSTAAPGTQNLSSLSVSTASPSTAESISETTRVPQVSTSLPPTTAKTLKTSPEISSATQSVSASSSISTQSNATSASTESPNSTAPIVPFPRRPTVLPRPITKSAHGEVSKTTPSTEVQPCLTQNVVKQCLIVIACLALVCTIFIFSTIVLCAKLSSRKRKRKPQKETEMMCISALLPERSYNYTRQHNPVPNGVLVIPRAEDSDDEVGDNLTLSSFLPENDRYV